jgi:inosine-uridine nucleoside N-ribohydrolase
LWDELEAAAWLDPKIITKEQMLYVDVDISRGPNYGDTLTWSRDDKPAAEMTPVHVQQDLDTARFYTLFVQLMKAEPVAAERVQ